MAAAIVPLILGVAPPVLSLIAGFVHQHAPAAQQTGQPGPAKLDQVFAPVITGLTQAAEAGTIPKALPSDELVKLIISSIVASMKVAGTLPDTKPVIPAPAKPTSVPQPVPKETTQSVTGKSKTTITITVEAQ